MLFELGQLTLLLRAKQNGVSHPDIQRAVGTSEKRETLLASADVLRISGTWQVLGDRIQTRRDGLISHATWILHIREDGSPCVAELLDFYPAATGKRSSSLSPGQWFEADAVYYPSAVPLRVLLENRKPLDPVDSTPLQLSLDPSLLADPLQDHTDHLEKIPWAQETPILLGPGRLAREPSGQVWWQSSTTESASLPLSNTPQEMLFGAPLDGGLLRWNGFQGDLICVQTTWGILHVDQ